MPSARLRVYVTPKADADVVIGWRGDELHVKVTAAPEGGKANAAAWKVVAKALRAPKSAVRVVRGGTGRHKALDVDGVSDDDMRRVFSS